MNDLDSKYSKVLAEIKEQIQSSEHLQSYLDEEDDQFYDALKQEFEEKIEALHIEVAQKDPLQLESLENELLDDSFEGLFLPRILGYSVLRGAVTDNHKYIRPQEHFKTVLLAICNSSNFDILRNRIGQTVEVGFALSSDIWITNLIAELKNKQVITFLQQSKHSKYVDPRSRHTSYVKYSKQFTGFNFLTAQSPKTAAEVKIEYKSVVNFLLYRASLGSDAGSSVYTYIQDILGNPSLGSSREHLEMLLIIGLFFDLKAPEQKQLVDLFNSYKGFEEDEALFSVLSKMQSGSHPIVDADYERLTSIISNTDLPAFKELLETIHKIDKIGYINTDAVDLARNYHNGNKGLSPQNECIRNVIFGKFNAFMSVLSVEDFIEYFELNKVFTTYMNGFDNEKFNQSVKSISMKYVKKLLKRYTEKRSKDYQDIKKFVSATFLDLGFLREKEIKELFKTKRKKPTPAS